MRAAHQVASQITDHDSVAERQLEALLAEERPTLVRLGLRYLWEAGVLSYRNVATAWHRQQRLFRLSSRSHPEFVANLPEGTARSLLIRHYFETFGPATLADAAWWSGLPKSAILAYLAEANVVRLRIPWTGGDSYLPSSVYEEALASPDERIGVSLLAHEDVALKAYSESRQRYLGNLKQPDIFNQIGEVRPVLLCEGIAIGTWEWDRSRNGIRLDVLDRAALVGHEDDVREAVATMECALRRGQAHG